MSTIHSEASEVYAWLGVDSSQEQLSPEMGSILANGPGAFEVSLLFPDSDPVNLDSLRALIQSLCSRHYWHRTCIQQEVVLAPSVVLLHDFDKPQQWDTFTAWLFEFDSEVGSPKHGIMNRVQRSKSVTTWL